MSMKVTILATFALVYTTLAVVSYVQKSATWDEPMHLTAGYVALIAGDHRVDPSHPPFMRMWAALPLLVLPPPVIDTSALDRVSGSQWSSQAYEYARRFLYVYQDETEAGGPCWYEYNHDAGVKNPIAKRALTWRRSGAMRVRRRARQARPSTRSSKSSTAAKCRATRTRRQPPTPSPPPAVRTSPNPFRQSRV